MQVESPITRRSMLLGSCAVWRIASANGPLEGKLDALRQKHGIPGLSAAILQKQQVAWSKAWGLADRERNISATPETPYRIASLTKTFASTLLLQQLGSERLAILDEPIVKYLAEDQRFINGRIADNVTVRHVLTHTSGDEPGSEYEYSGARFSRLTFVVEKLSGQDFRSLLAGNILDKARMARSVPGQDATAARYQPVLKDLAKPYKLDNAGQIVASEYPPRRISASAGIISTVLDLARYDAAIDRNEFISQDLKELAWTPMRSTSGKTLPYGLGWFIQRYRGLRLIWHYGYWPGSFSALYLKIPERGTTFLLLANSDGLSRPFPLGEGDLTASAFALAFLETIAI